MRLPLTHAGLFSSEYKGLFLRIYGSNGALIPFDHERSRRLVALDQQVAATRLDNEVLRQQLVEMADTLARLRRQGPPAGDA